METTKKEITCPECSSTSLMKNGTGVRAGGPYQQYVCKECKFHFRVVLDETVDSKINVLKNRKMGLTEDQLRLKHDISYQTQKAADALEKGVYLTQSEFIAGAGIKAIAGYKHVIEHPDFARYRGKAGGTVYWGHPDSIEKMKKDNVLS